MGYYFLIGLIYTFINGYIRKIDTEGDFLLPMVWLCLWPICFIGLAACFIQNKIEKYKV